LPCIFSTAALDDGLSESQIMVGRDRADLAGMADVEVQVSTAT
jgi:hypothetical protein